ncbi:lytic transglycosylase domain-containing protein [Limnohabitans sp.]|uniref:lytic transglycosylase domain-containing protein n=1 Tax=Limnohabitans sp. TaxID=1907725 RepID=UPI00286F854B|nr:lytic transglycosylase domain-containing protein [Limnohabitans sp.]
MVRCIRLFSRVWCVLLISASAHAGSQREEPLIDSVRTALSAVVHPSGPPTLVHADNKAGHMFQQWLAQTEARLEKQVQRRKASAAPAHVATAAATPNGPPDLLTHELANPHLRREFLQTVWYESQRAGLEPSLVLGLVQVESGFRKFAISSAGARGFMQVMPFWTRVLAEGDASVLFQAQTNLRFGCVILRHYLNLENGDLVLALGRYNGSRGQVQYPNAVLAAQKGWQ